MLLPRRVNLNLDYPMWFAMGVAYEYGCNSWLNESWTTDEKLKEPLGKILYESIDDQADAHLYVFDVIGKTRTESDHDIIELSLSRRSIFVRIYTRSAERCREILATLKQKFPTAPKEPNKLEAVFWYATQNGPRSYSRAISAPSWKQIEDNYPSSTRQKLISLLNIEPSDSGGKLVLWQGEPGTGKTYALRALAEEWSEWCRIHYILDPEKFFSDGGYLLNVILGKDDPGIPISEAFGANSASATKRGQWRLIVLEDAGEMLTKDAKNNVGQGLARLLNLCDGLLGQGLQVMILITTNEQIGALHAAVSRPGRCLAKVEFEKFKANEAAKWMQSRGVNYHPELPGRLLPATLADLYAILQGRTAPETPRKSVGFSEEE